MSITVFGFLVVAVGLWCQFRPFGATIVTMTGLTVFGSAGALELPALGGASVTPADLFILFYALRLLSMRQGFGLLSNEISPARPLFLFALLNLWICGTALIMPRLFDSATFVFSLSRDADGLAPLHPTSGNISQVVYAMGGFVLACATAAYARRPNGAPAFLKAVVLVTTLDIAFALLDLVTSATRTGFLLDLIHTANYAFLTADELGGVKRISGSFSEASAFASFSLILLGVNFPLYVMRVRSRFTGPASAILTALIALSTSSSGYAGLAVFFAGFLVHAIAQAAFSGRRRPLAIAALIGGVGVFCGACVILFLPALADTVGTVLSQSLLNKAGSDSAIERGSWNQQAWRIFLDTDGVGAGIGATRTSSYVLLLLSNLGIVGFLLFLATITRVLFGRLRPSMPSEEAALVWAARIGLAIALFANTLVGTVYYLGAFFYILLGLAASGLASAPVTSSVRGPTGGRIASSQG